MPVSRDRLARLLKELLEANRSDEQILEALYLAALVRLPVEKERTSARKMLAKVQDRQVAFKNVLQSLIDSPEFGTPMGAPYGKIP